MLGTDEELMATAGALAEPARFATPPNPWVGCVVVRDGEIVGTGRDRCRTRRGSHAEVAALADAGDRARGATVYVTLEPCNHHGNTPPCTEALIAAGVAAVTSRSRIRTHGCAARACARLRDGRHRR